YPNKEEGHDKAEKLAVADHDLIDVVGANVKVDLWRSITLLRRICQVCVYWCASERSLLGSRREALFGDNASSGGAANHARSLRSLARLLGRSLTSPTRTPRLSHRHPYYAHEMRRFWMHAKSV